MAFPKKAITLMSSKGRVFSFLPAALCLMVVKVMLNIVKPLPVYTLCKEFIKCKGCVSYQCHVGKQMFANIPCALDSNMPSVPSGVLWMHDDLYCASYHPYK